ncbi:MAG TPA: polysaccharide deacetylase family protein [Solirubrobacteraceae bacterium]
MDDGHSTLQEGPGRGPDEPDTDDRPNAADGRPTAAGDRPRTGGDRPTVAGERPRGSGDRPRGPVAPHHRRRRAVAGLVATAAVALITGLVIGALSSGSPTPAPKSPVVTNGFFRRIKMLASGGAGSFVVDEQRAEGQAITHTLSYTPYVRAAGTQHKEVALTFDDGPGPYTPDILRVLVRKHAPATFFEVGLEEHYFHAATAQIVARGYPIGDHTESHLPMSQLKRKAQLAQLIEDSDAIGNYGAPFPRMFRPPYGVWNHATVGLLRKYNMLMVLWSVDTDDYERPGVNVIVKRALAGLEPGAIILLHDAGGDRSQTVAALPRIIKAVRKRGYKLVTVPRLLLDNPAPKDQNVAGLVGAGG